ncbi:hypothetical protein OS493_032336 [Desmophyllum pertusum]|uniref:Uncharacterized protein n=1 Tax=Desmophyllum pertusum TaxID=174260 RepID=A0A9W9YW46_9CNID|nr:hypothetical protein OS493_032336 [Desmophyllum pertusum]
MCYGVSFTNRGYDFMMIHNRKYASEMLAEGNGADFLWYVHCRHFRVCANQGESGINEQTVEERLACSSSFLLPVSSNVLGLVDSTDSLNVHPVKSTLEGKSSVLQAFSRTPRTSVTKATNIMHSQALTTSLAHASIKRVANGSHLTSVETPAIKQSQARTPSLALTRTSESGAVTLTSLPPVSTVVISQNQSASHVASSQAGSSSQVSVETTSQKKDAFTTLHLSPSWFVGAGSMTTKASLSSSIPIKPSLSTTSVFAYTPVPKSSISPSGNFFNSCQYMYMYNIPANSHALCVCHACGSKTSITCIQDNFTRLTHNSGLIVLNH